MTGNGLRQSGKAGASAGKLWKASPHRGTSRSADVRAMFGRTA